MPAGMLSTIYLYEVISQQFEVFSLTSRMQEYFRNFNYLTLTTSTAEIKMT